MTDHHETTRRPPVIQEHCQNPFSITGRFSRKVLPPPPPCLSPLLLTRVRLQQTKRLKGRAPCFPKSTCVIKDRQHLCFPTNFSTIQEGKHIYPTSTGAIQIFRSQPVAHVLEFTTNPDACPPRAGVNQQLHPGDVCPCAAHAAWLPEPILFTPNAKTRRCVPHCLGNKETQEQ